jgi:lysophospholipase L1-like esterase
MRKVEHMEQVVLIGDSIRMGYQATVAEALDGVAEVWAPEENGGDSANVLAHLDDWVIERQPDVVHLNAGLHDLKLPFDSDTHQVPLDDYRRNLETIVQRVHSETRSALVLATTTPVHQAWHHAVKDFDRFESDVDAYNAVLRDVARSAGIDVTDLFGLVTMAGKDRVLQPDGVHFKEEGSRFLGHAVAERILACLERIEDHGVEGTWGVEAIPPTE